MKRTIWRRAFEVQANERSKFWESPRRDDPLETDDLELLFVIVKSFYRNTLTVEYYTGEDGFYVLETTKHHCRDHNFSGTLRSTSAPGPARLRPCRRRPFLRAH